MPPFALKDANGQPLEIGDQVVSTGHPAKWEMRWWVFPRKLPAIPPEKGRIVDIFNPQKPHQIAGAFVLNRDRAGAMIAFENGISVFSYVPLDVTRVVDDRA